MKKVIRHILAIVISFGLLIPSFAPLEAAQRKRPQASRRAQARGASARRPQRAQAAPAGATSQSTTVQAQQPVKEPSVPMQELQPVQEPAPVVPAPKPVPAEPEPGATPEPQPTPAPKPQEPAPTLQPPAHSSVPAAQQAVTVGGKKYTFSWILNQMETSISPKVRTRLAAALKKFKEPTPEQREVVKKWALNKKLTDSERNAWLTYRNAALTSTRAKVLIVGIILAALAAGATAAYFTFGRKKEREEQEKKDKQEGLAIGTYKEPSPSDLEQQLAAALGTPKESKKPAPSITAQQEKEASALAAVEGEQRAREERDQSALEAIRSEERARAGSLAPAPAPPAPPAVTTPTSPAGQSLTEQLSGGRSGLRKTSPVERPATPVASQGGIWGSLAERIQPGGAEDDDEDDDEDWTDWD